MNTREHYLANNPDFGTDVLRVQDLESLPCWYGYIYTKNSSAKELRETLWPAVEGFSILYPFGGGQAGVELRLAPGEDHIVILRRA